MLFRQKVNEVRKEQGMIKMVNIINDLNEMIKQSKINKVNIFKYQLHF